MQVQRRTLEVQEEAPKNSAAEIRNEQQPTLPDKATHVAYKSAQVVTLTD